MHLQTYAYSMKPPVFSLGYVHSDTQHCFQKPRTFSFCIFVSFKRLNLLILDIFYLY